MVVVCAWLSNKNHWHIFHKLIGVIWCYFISCLFMQMRNLKRNRPIHKYHQANKSENPFCRWHNWTFNMEHINLMKSFEFLEYAYYLILQPATHWQSQNSNFKVQVIPNRNPSLLVGHTILQFVICINKLKLWKWRKGLQINIHLCIHMNRICILFVGNELKRGYQFVNIGMFAQYAVQIVRSEL